MSTGAQLRASREARGLTLDQVAKATRVQPRILAAIERDDVAAVPPRPFGRGFVKAYAEELGLDAEQAAHAYFARFAPPPPDPGPVASTASTGSRHRPRAWMLAVGVSGLAVGVALAFLTRSPDRAADPATAVAPAIGTSGTGSPGERTDTPEATPTDAAAPPLSVVLTAQRPSWVTATADGHREIYRILAPGSPAHLVASETVTIRVGDAGAVSWRINGRDAGAMGRPGQIRDVRLTTGNAGSIQ